MDDVTDRRAVALPVGSLLDTKPCPGGTENAGLENAGLENEGPNRKGGKRRMENTGTSFVLVARCNVITGLR